MNLQDLTMALCNASGPSGFEEPVSGLIEELIAPYVDQTYTDVMGNLICVRKSGKEHAKRLMLEAHIDEVGLMVTGIEEGFLRFSNIGGVDPRMLPASDVRVLAPEPLFGVIGTLPPHILKAEEMEKAAEIESLFIDVGLSQERAQQLVPLGTPVVFAGRAEPLGSRMISGKALDNRASAAILIKTLEYLQSKELEVDLYVLMSTQEELSMRGATAGAFALEPDYCVVLDVTFGHTPDSAKAKTLPLGAGAAIGVGPNINKGLSDLLIELAREKEIPYQIEVLPGNSGTGCWAIQVSRQGVCTALISLPIKYMHSPVGVMDMHDGQMIVRLLAGLVERIGEGL